MRNLFVFIITIFIGFGPIQGQQLGFRLTAGTKKVEVPFELYNNLVVVPVMLNDQLPLKFIIDTGVRTAILTEKTYSDILGLTYSKHFLISGIGKYKQIEAFITNNVTLTLPGVKGEGHALLVLNEDYLELRNYLGTDVHGILGYELFSRFIVKLDYDRKVMTLTTPRYFKRKRSYRKIPIKIEDTKPYIKGMVLYNNKKRPVSVKLLIDTGASHGILLDQDSEKKIVIPEKNLHCNLGRGLGGELEGKIGRLQAFALGGNGTKFCWRGPLATFPQENTFLDSLKYGKSDRNGSIGGSLISRLKIIFDFPGEAIYVKKGSDFKDDFTYNMSGLTIKAIGSRLNTYEITEVRENSPGNAIGLRPEDIILSINHINTKHMNLNQLQGLLNKRPNKKIVLEILRGEKQYKYKFRLKNQI